jgi:hypothetical protein
VRVIDATPNHPLDALSLTDRTNSEHATHVRRNIGLGAGVLTRTLFVRLLAHPTLVTAKLGFHAYPLWLPVEFLEFTDRKDLEILPDTDLLREASVRILFQPLQNEK